MDKPECPDCGSDDTEPIGAIRGWTYRVCNCCTHFFAVRKPADQIARERNEAVRES